MNLFFFLLKLYMSADRCHFKITRKKSKEENSGKTKTGQDHVRSNSGPTIPSGNHLVR